VKREQKGRKKKIAEVREGAAVERETKKWNTNAWARGGQLSRYPHRVLVEDISHAPAENSVAWTRIC